MNFKKKKTKGNRRHCCTVMLVPNETHYFNLKCNIILLKSLKTSAFGPSKKRFNTNKISRFSNGNH